jgi:CDP-glycerol glycerophosphotransferase (TagB/SpsB family)
MKPGPAVLEKSYRWIAAHFFRICDHVIPKDNRVVLVTFPDGDDQGVALCLGLATRKSRGKIFWLVHQDPAPFRAWQERRGFGHVDVQFTRLYSLGGVWTYLRSSFVFYTHGALFNYAPPRRKLVVNLWHGMPIKRIWQGVPGSVLPLSTFLISTSPFFSDVLMRASGFGPERLLATGLPRNDFLTRARPRAVDMVARWRGEAHRLIFFLPTYRTSARGLKAQDGKETNSVLGFGEADARRMHAWLKSNGCKLIVKPHPMSINVGKRFVDDECWAMVDEEALFNAGLGLYELLAESDLLVTDVSSVYVDFLVTQKPQIFYFPDFAEYEATRGLLLNPLKDYAPGPITESFDGLMAQLELWLSGQDSWREQRKHLRDLMVPASPRSAALSVLTAVGFQAQ